MTRESVFRSRLLSNNTRKFILFITLVWVISGIISFYQYRHSAKISRHSAKEKEKTYNLIKELNSCKQTVQYLISKTKSCLNQQKSDATKSTQNEEDVIYEDIDDNLESITNNEQQTPSSNNIAVLIFTFQRAEYLKRALDAIFKYIPQYGFDVYVSQDGDHQAVTHTIQSFGSRVHHLKHPRNFEIPEAERKKRVNPAYYAIAQHYGWALRQVFEEQSVKYDKVIVLEEDIEIAPDFFEYFQALSFLLDVDPSLYCISGFNDNGMKGYVKDPIALYRTDFFPGLGWMLTRKLWEEIGPNWPKGYWDDWMRLPSVRKGRQCIRPEVPRTYTFGAKGVSGGQFFNQFLQHIQLSSIPINWQKIDLSYLIKEKYDSQFSETVNRARVTTISELSKYDHQEIDLKIIYSSKEQFIQFAKHFKIMQDLKKGVPRCAYKGIVSFIHKHNRIFLVPSTPELTYETT